MITLKQFINFTFIFLLFLLLIDDISAAKKHQRRHLRFKHQKRTELNRSRRQSTVLLDPSVLGNNNQYNNNPYGNNNNRYPYSNQQGPFQNQQTANQLYKRWKSCHEDPRCDPRSLDDWWNLYRFGKHAQDLDLLGSYHRETQISLHFDMPFFGYRYNYTMVYPDGGITFGWPSNMAPPYAFPNPKWPVERDVAMLAIYWHPAMYQYVGEIPITKVWFRTVHRRNIENIGWLNQNQGYSQGQGNPFQANQASNYQSNSNSYANTNSRNKRQVNSYNQQGSIIDPEFLNNITKDIQDAQNGAQGFSAQMALVVTWERMAYEGASREIDVSRFGDVLQWQNTYQMVVATDQIRTYAMYNYAHLNWTSSNLAGGLNGKGGKQTAIVGFNGGNGTGFYGIPYSGGRNVWMLSQFSNALEKGRWVFRVDEEIIRGGCSNASRGSLSISPPFGVMVGNVPINMSGACMRPQDPVRVTFDQWPVDCKKVNRIRVICVMPMFHKVGWMTVRMTYDGGKSYPFMGYFYVLNPHRFPPQVTLFDQPFSKTNRWNVPEAKELSLQWQALNLTHDMSARVDISLYGYYEDAFKSHWNLIDHLTTSHQNDGTYSFQPQQLIRNPLIPDAWKKYRFGMISVGLHNQYELGVQWSSIIPFGWYWLPVWKREYGNNWAIDMCIEWFEYEGKRNNFFQQLNDQPCPCKLEQALLDVGRFIPFFDCDVQANNDCPHNKGATHCIQSMEATPMGAGQQCCYDYDGYLMFSDDWEPTGDYTRFFQPAGPARGSFFGSPPYTRQPPRIPGMSHYMNDLMPYEMCCSYAEHCEFYYWRRQTHTCQGYNPPGAAMIYGDPHIRTFDGVEYNFPGKGYYVLVMSDDPEHKLMVQARLEQPAETFWHSMVNATVVTGVAIKENNSDTVHVFARKVFRRWRYHTDVYVNNRKIFFDMPHWKYQQFKGLSIRNPQLNMNQSDILVMMKSGAGIRIRESFGMLSVMVTLPPHFNQSCDPSSIWTPAAAAGQSQRFKRWCYPTRGLLGAFDGRRDNDLMKADGTSVGVGVNNYGPGTTERLYTSFGQTYMVNRYSERYYPFLMNDNYKPINNPIAFGNPNYQPTFYINQVPMDAQMVFTIAEVIKDCMGVAQCEYDYLVTGQRQVAINTLQIHQSFVMHQKDGSHQVVSCGPLQKQPGVIKSPAAKNYLQGDKVSFACQPEYFIHGTQERVCLNGTWSPGWWVWCRDRDLEYGLKYMTGILVSVLIIIVIVVLFCCCWKRRQDQDESKIYRTREPIHYQPVKVAPPIVSQPYQSKSAGDNSYDREPVRIVTNANGKTHPIIHETMA